MGRVRPLKDTGDPGKLYFTEPIVENIKGKNKPVTPPSNNVMILHSSGTTPDGVCRLASSHKIMDYTPPTDLVYAMGEWPTQLEVDDYLQRAHVAGFGEGAIVTRRHQTKNRWRYHHQWGLMVVENNQKPYGARKYAPFMVKWFITQEVEQAWAEDLVVIHQCLSQGLLASIVEDQGVEL